MEATIEDFMLRARAALNDDALVASVVCAVKSLETLGYAVVPNVLSREVCDAYHTQFWEVMEKASAGHLKRPHSAQDLESFKISKQWPRNMHGILEDGCFGHLPFVHEIRCNPRVQLVFALLYGTGKNITSSVDRMNYQLPPEWLPRAQQAKATNRQDIGRVEEAAWLHIDQSPSKLGLHCIQGLVNLEDADQDGDASLELVPASHLLHNDLEAITDDHNIPNMDWYKFPEEVKQKVENEMGILRSFQSVKASKGSIILWDSRCWHQGGRMRAHALTPRPIPRPRFVVYICYQPNLLEGATALPSKELAKRETIFSKHRVASHWPLSSKVFGPPRTYGKQSDDQLVFDFSSFLMPRAEVDNYPVMKHTYGLAYDNRIDVLDGQERPALLDFAPSSGVNKRHIPPPENKRPRKKSRVE